MRLGLGEQGSTEGQRASSLFTRLSDSSVEDLLATPAVDSLLSLKPPLETVLAHPREELRKAEAQEAIRRVRQCRTVASREALAALSKLLLIVRNKRVHGFKTPDGLRDRQVLEPATEILQELAEACLDARVAADLTEEGDPNASVQQALAVERGRGFDK